MSTVQAPVQIIIAQTTSAVAASDATIFTIDAQGGTLSADDLAGVEEVDIEYRAGVGATWDLFYDEGAAVKLTATKPHVTLIGRGQYRVAKDPTAAACGVYVVR